MTTFTTGSPRLIEGHAATPLSATYCTQNHTDEQPNVEEPPREYFTFYRSFRNSISRAPVEVRLALYEAIADYALDLVEPSESDLGPMGMMVWELLLPILRASRRKYEAGRKGGAPKGTVNNPKGVNQYQQEDNQRITNGKAEDNQRKSNKQITNNNKQETNNNKQITSNNKEETNNNIQKLNFEDNQERDLERKSGKRFSPPSLIDVRNYLEEIDYRTITAEQFVDYYESVGWKVGGKPMQDWRAAIRQWQRRDQSAQQSPAGQSAQQSPAGAHPNQYTNPTKSNNYGNHHTQLDTPRTTASGSQSNGGRPNGPNGPNNPNNPNSPNTASTLESRRIRPNGSHSLEPLESRRVRPAGTLEPSFDYSDLKGGNRLPDLKFTPTDDCIGGYSSIHFSGKYEKGFV
ncbi:MAG: hypothetical protein IKB03_00200 [Tidjanibacter sp.]|nr:hypothetical protein [Tidjanibacter sp.]